MNTTLNRKRRLKLALKKSLDLLLRYLESRPFRAGFWIVISIILSYFIALIVWAIRLGFTGTTSFSVFLQTWIVLAGLFILINLLIVFRSEYLEYDPWIDLRYHARIHNLISQDESNFLLTFHRTGTPTEMYASKTSTLNRIEQAFPFTLFSSSFSIALVSLFFTGYLLGALPQGVTVVELITFSVMIFFSAFPLYLGFTKGIHSFWERYRSWKDFWTAYWEYVVCQLEPTATVTRVVEERGGWEPIVGWRLWGTEYNLDDPEVNEHIRERVNDILSQYSISDNIPSSNQTLISYLDSLALYIDIKEFMNQHSDELERLSKESTRWRNTMQEFNGITSLKGSNTRELLASIDETMSLLPVAKISLLAFDEINDVGSIPSEASDKVIEWAESRLQEFWSMSGSPLPSSLKWITAFYSFASLLATWISSILWY